MQGKLYADERRHAKHSEISIGDVVMMKNYDNGKLEPNFKLEKFTVLKRSGNDTLIANEDGVKYRRPVAHLKKWPSSSFPSCSYSSTDPHDPTAQQPTETSEEGEQQMKRKDSADSGRPQKPQKRVRKPEKADSKEIIQTRPVRTKTIPKRYS